MMMYRLFKVTSHAFEKASLCKVPTVSFSCSIRLFSEVAKAPRVMVSDILEKDKARQRSLDDLSNYLRKTSLEFKGVSKLERKIVTYQVNADEEKLIDMAIEHIREKYGIRRLSIEDNWLTILIVTYPEQWVKEQVAQKGVSIVSALIGLMKYMVPKVSCTSVEDLNAMLSLTSANESEKNDEDSLVDLHKGLFNHP